MWSNTLHFEFAKLSKVFWSMICFFSWKKNHFHCFQPLSWVNFYSFRYNKTFFAIYPWDIESTGGNFFQKRSWSKSKFSSSVWKLFGTYRVWWLNIRIDEIWHDPSIQLLSNNYQFISKNNVSKYDYSKKNKEWILFLKWFYLLVYAKISTF